MVNLQEPLKITQLRLFPFTLAVMGFLCLFSSVDLTAQDDLNIHGVVSDAMTSSKLGSVDVTVHKDGTQVDKFTTRNNGKYEFYLNVGHSYAFYFEKPGYVKRSIQIDSRNIPEEVVGAGIIMPTDMSMFSITAAMEDADLSIFDKPIGKASYDPVQADLVWDFQYTQKVKGEINAFIRDLQKKKKDVSEEDQAAAEEQTAFENLVKEGDAAMLKENFDEAVTKYSSALEIKPDDQNVKAKLGDAETQRNRLRDAERKNKEYNDAIAAADDAFKNEEYENAVAKYKDALKVKPGEAYPATQIESAELIMKDLAEQSAKQREYDENMRAGNRAMDDEKYETAVAAFERAMEIMPEEKEAEKRRDTAADLLSKQKAEAEAQAAYTAAIEKADALYDQEKYEAAKAEYTAALNSKPSDTYASERKSACDTKLAEIAEAEARRAEFDELMTDGDNALDGEDYALAVEKFEAALGIFPDNVETTAKRDEARGLLDAELAEKQKREDYDRLITEADKAFGKDAYDEALGLYSQARELIPEETRPTERINEIKGILASLEAAQAAQEAYDKAMMAAREAVAAESFDTALKKYDEALQAKEDDADALKEKAEAEAKKQAYEAKMAEDAAYAEKISEADRKRDADELDVASGLYTEASAIKPEEAYPKDEIEKIEKIKADRAAQKAEEERLAALRAEFDGLMDAGEKAFDAEDYAEAIEKFSRAAGVLPENERAPQRKAEAEAKLAEKAQAEARDAAYAEAIASADADFNAENFEAAKSGYVSASEIKPEESYPTDQVALIEERLAAMAAAKAEAEAKAKNEQVAALLGAGDRMVADNDFDGGIEKYSEALAILPERKDIPQKIADAEAAQQAWLQTQAEDEAYAGVISKADEAFEAKNWEAARRNYRQATEIKPEEAHPKDRLALTDQREAEEAEAKAAARKAEADALIDAGDALVSDKSFEEGIEKYREAAELMPERTDIPEKIAAAEAAKLAWAEARANAEAYDEIIAEADEAFAAKDWKTAGNAYKEAIGIKPNEKYPKDRLALAEANQQAEADARAAAEKAAVDALVAEGDNAFAENKFARAADKYEEALDAAPDREDIRAKLESARNKQLEMMESAALDEAYADAVSAGDKAFDKENWDEALGHYEEAAGLKPAEKYPKNRMAEINAKLAAFEKNAAEAEAAELRRQYDALIDAGDSEFGKQKYKNALNEYRAALALLPDAETAKTKIAETEKAISERDALAADRSAYENTVSEADTFYSDEDYEMALMRYEDALEIRPGEKHPSKRIGEINKILERIRLEKERDADAAKEAEYTAAVKRGDDAMRKKKYSEAIDDFEDALEVKPDEQYPQSRIEQAQLAISEMEAERERMAAEKAARAAQKEDEDDYQTVSRKSEEQAEAFMREALDAQEREKYERIKKLKAEQAVRIADRNENSALLRSANFEELMAYYDYSRQIAEEGNQRREKKASNSEKYKRTLYKNMGIQAERGRARGDEAYSQISKDAMGIRDAEHRRMESNLEELREIARKNRLFTEEYSAYYRKRNAEVVESGSAEIRKTTEEFNTQLDERKQKADLQRSKNLEEAYNKMRGDAKHTDFFRMELALEYPQGVTEESSTMGNKVIITRIVVNGSKGDEYRKVLDKAGNYYFKNGQSISEITWNRETLDAFYNKD